MPSKPSKTICRIFIDIFSPVLEKEMRKTNSGPGQIDVIEGQVEEVKGIMNDNIQEVLDRYSQNLS